MYASFRVQQRKNASSRSGSGRAENTAFSAAEKKRPAISGPSGIGFSRSRSTPSSLPRATATSARSPELDALKRMPEAAAGPSSRSFPCALSRYARSAAAEEV